MKSRFVQGRCSAPAHLSRPTLAEVRGVASPRAEFISKLGERSQEADETQLWLELLREECGIDCSLSDTVEQEANELIAHLHDDHPPHGSEVENGISLQLSNLICLAFDLP